MAHWKWLVTAGLIAVFVIALFWRDDVNAFSDFDFSNPRVDREKILRGGPPKDGIPAIHRPDFVSAKEAEDFMKDSDRVMAFSMDGVSRAYPIKILNRFPVILIQITLAEKNVYIPTRGLLRISHCRHKNKEHQDNQHHPFHDPHLPINKTIRPPMRWELVPR